MGPSEGQPSAENVNVAAWPVAGIGGRQLRSDSDQIACRMWCDFEVAVVDVGMALRLPVSCPWWAPAVGHFQALTNDRFRATNERAGGASGARSEPACDGTFRTTLVPPGRT